MKTHSEIEDVRLRELHKLAYDLKYIRDLKANHGFNPPLAYAVSDELMYNVLGLTKKLDTYLNEMQENLEAKVQGILLTMGHTQEEVDILLPILEDSFYRFMYKQKEMGDK